MKSRFGIVGWIVPIALLSLIGCMTPLRRSTELRRAGQLEEAYELLRDSHLKTPENKKLAQAFDDVKRELAQVKLDASRVCDVHDLIQRRLFLTSANEFYPTLDGLVSEAKAVDVLLTSVRQRVRDARSASDATTGFLGFAELRPYQPYVDSVQKLGVYVAGQHKTLTNELRELAGQGRMNRAISLAAACRNFFPQANDCRLTLKDFLGLQGRDAVRTAREAAASSDGNCIATAMTYSLFASNFAPEDSETRDVFEEVRKEFTQRLKANLFVLSSAAFSTTHVDLIRKAFETESSSERFAYILDASSASQLSENDSIVVIELEDMSVETLTTETLKQSTYLAGYRSVTNPEYSRILANYNKHAQDARVYAAQVANNPFMAIAQGLAIGSANAAAKSLRATPQHLQKPIHQDYSYTEFEHRFPMIFSLTYQIFDPSQSDPWKRGLLQYELTESKVSIVGAHSEDVRGIANFDVPSSTAAGLLAEFTTTSLSRVASEICSRVKARPLHEAVAAAKIGASTIAKERFLEYVLWQADSRLQNDGWTDSVAPSEWLREIGVGSIEEVCNGIDLQEAEQVEFGLSAMLRDTITSALPSAETDRNLDSLIQAVNCTATDDINRTAMPYRTLGDIQEMVWPGASKGLAPLDNSVVRECLDSVVVVKTKHGSGSGFFVSSNGLIVTNYHVIGDDEDIIVKTAEGGRYFACVVDTSKFRDLALLQVDGADKRPLPLGQIGANWQGQVVYALGAPGGPKGRTLEQTVTRGVVSAVRRMPAPYNPNLEIEFVQTDAALNPGSSGGPLIDQKGNVVGVNTQKYVREDIEGLNFAISTSEIRAAFSARLP